MGNNSSSEHRRHQEQRPSAYPPAPVYNSGPPQGHFYQPGPVYNQYGQQAHAQYGHYNQPPTHYHPPYPGSYGTPNPYQAPMPKTQECQRTDTIKNQVNLKKPTLRLEKTSVPDVYSIAFKFDASAPCRVTTFVNASEDLRRACKISALSPVAPPLNFPKALEQTFPPSDNPAGAQHCVDLRQQRLEDLLRLGASQPSAPSTSAATAQPTSFAVMIRLEALTDEGRAAQRTLESLEPGCELPDWVQAQTTYARIVQEHEGELALRIIKQKIWYKGDSYELQEIYGMERGTRALGTPVDTEPVTGEGFEDVEGNECVICMSAPRDTAALPCRHMCMCHQCAGALKTQTNKCPICRNEIKKLLHIKINQQPAAGAGSSAAPPAGPTTTAVPA